MSLLIETPPPEILRKRMLDDGQSRKTTQSFKRSRASFIRNFPCNCGPLAPDENQGSLDEIPFEISTSKIREKDASLQGNIDLADSHPPFQPLKFDSKYPTQKIRRGVTISRTFPPNCGADDSSSCEVVVDAEVENSKGIVVDSLKSIVVDSALENLKATVVDENSKSIVVDSGFENSKAIIVNSSKSMVVDSGLENLNPKEIAVDSSKSVGLGNSKEIVVDSGLGNSKEKVVHTELENSKVITVNSSKSMVVDSRLENSKEIVVHTGLENSKAIVVESGLENSKPIVLETRLVNSKSIVVEARLENSKANLCTIIVEMGDTLIEDDNQDSVATEEKLNVVCNGYVAKDQDVPNSPNKQQIKEPVKCDFERKDDEINDMDICILTPLECKQLQSGFKLQNNNKRDVGDELVVEEIEKQCEGFVELDIDTESRNLSIVPFVKGDEVDVIVARNNVQKTLKHFEELYTELVLDYKAKLKGGKLTKQMHTQAAMLLKNQQKWVNVQDIFGDVPGVEVGDQFQFRVQLAMVGLHHQFISGINCVTVNRKKYANSVVDSGRYENKTMSRDVIIYSGQGGNPKIHPRSIDKTEDQKLEGANLALKNSMEENLPIRVIRKTMIERKQKIYIYEGLYKVTKFWKERIGTSKMAFMFEMVRVAGQTVGICPQMNDSRASIGYLEREQSDLSQRKEKIPIKIVNDLNDEKPHPFTYITKLKYPDCYRISEPCGCNCIDGCSDSKPCYCAFKNGGEIPFNEQGSIIKAKRLVHECGTSCKCPPSCQNRVSQRGPRFQLEVFKTKSRGWGVRSREEIPSGSFICEYIGEVLADNEADQRSNDEYLFDLYDGKGFTIDAAQYGNVGRFINHSCSPNLYAQNVLYDNDDKRLPHVMFFATKKIPALQELSYDYNYKVDRVCDAEGNIRTKICHCGSRKCNGRMY